jgi:hypothetical protein
MARRCAISITQVVALPLAGSNREALRHTFEQDFLGNLLRLGRVPDDLADQAVRRAGQPVIDLLERTLITSRHPPEQPVKVLLAGVGRASARLGHAHIACVHTVHSRPPGRQIGTATAQSVSGADLSGYDRADISR